MVIVTTIHKLGLVPFLKKAKPMQRRSDFSLAHASQVFEKGDPKQRISTNLDA